MSELPLPYSPLLQSSGQLSSSPLNDLPTAADDPNYENITFTFKNQDQPKGSHSPPKNKGKQPHTSPPQPLSQGPGRGLWEALQGQRAVCEGQGQWCGGVVASRLCVTVVGGQLCRRR